jgi:D-aminopeptidase
MGLIQVEELGTIETPLILTNTLSAGTAYTACVRYMLERNPGIGGKEGSVNPVILECNDGYLNDIRALTVREEDARAALDAAGADFALGAVGAGRGMSCYQLKGGIGSASRVFRAAGKRYTLGALVMTNFGSTVDLLLGGRPVGRRLASKAEDAKGSCVMVLATNAPLSSRQLLRAAHRAQSGLARTGAVTEQGSGELAVAFSTANRVPMADRFWTGTFLNDGDLNPVFRAVTECVEEAIIRSMLEAETVKGFQGHCRLSLRDALAGLDGDETV